MRLTMQFEFDQISGPGSDVDYEIEATVSGLSAHNSEHTLRQLFARAGINWQPVGSVRAAPSNGRN
jgi:hypothetical protein